MSTLNVGAVTEFNAQQVIADLLVEFSGPTALERYRVDAQFARQSVEEVVWRTAGNLLRSQVTHKPAGQVVFPENF